MKKYNQTTESAILMFNGVLIYPKTIEKEKRKISFISKTNIINLSTESNKYLLKTLES